MQLYNYANQRSDDPYQPEYTSTSTKDVVAPLSPSYLDMTGGNAPNIGSYLDYSIQSAYQTTGLAKSASDFRWPNFPSFHTNAYRTSRSTCYIVSVFYIVHFMYCSLENVNIPSN